MSDARKVSPSPRPTTIGLTRTHGDDLARIVYGDHDQGIGALGTLHRGTYGFDEIAVVVASDEMGEDFRIRVGREFVTEPTQLAAKGCEVLDDPVVDDDEFTRRVGMRVSIRVVGNSMRCPPRVADAD